VAYKVGNKIIREMPADLAVYEKCRPIYRSFAGWQDTRYLPEADPSLTDKLQINHKQQTTNYKQLPVNMRKYLAFIEKEVNVPIEMVSVGAEREATIIKEK